MVTKKGKAPVDSGRPRQTDPVESESFALAVSCIKIEGCFR